MHHLPVLLQRTAGLLLLTAAGRSACRSAAMLLAAALGAVFLDGVLALPAWMRIGIDVAGVALVCGAAFVVLRMLFGNGRDPRQTARRIERSLGYSDNRLINALELSERPSSASKVLVEHVVRRGESEAAELSSTAAVDFRPFLRSLGFALGAAVVVLACRWGMPGLFAAVGPRYFDPRGDHPPYTLVTFDVRVTPDPILYGKPAEIVAALGGPELVGQADVVFVEDEAVSRRIVQRLPMFKTADGEFTLPVPKAERSQAFYIETPRGRSTLHRLTVEEIPSIDEAVAVLHFPKYTGWKDARQPLDVRGLRGLVGTEASVTLTANLPLRSGRIELVPEGTAGNAPEVVTLQPAGNDRRTVTGRFPLRTTGRYRITVTSDKGAECRDPVEGKVTVAADRPPQVGIVHPEPQLVVVEGYTVPVIVQASDDVGIATLRLSASINGFGPSPVELQADLREPTAARGTAEFALAELGAKAGDVITYFATAWDRAPPDGQFAESATHVIRVISEDEYLEYARSEYQMNELVAEMEELQKKLDELRRQREDLQKDLETLQKKLKEEGALSKEDQEAMDELQRKLTKFAELSEKMAKEAKARSEQRPLYDVEESLLEMLEQLSKQLEEQSELAKDAADDLERLKKDPTDEELRKELQESLDALKKQAGGLDEEGDEEREQLHQEMNRLRKVDELVQQGQRLQKVVDKQRDVADRLGEFRDRDKLNSEDQQRADRLAREQERLQQELDDAVKKLEETAKECEGECPATAGDAQKLAQAIREQKIGEDQQEAAGSARKGDGRKAHSAAESAAEKLEALAENVPDAEGAAQEMAGNDPGLKLSKPGMGKSLKQMAQARQLPGLRGMSGSKPGQKAGQKPGEKPGEDGDGRQGSMARSTMLGPHQPLGNTARPRIGAQGADGPSVATEEMVRQPGGEAESLTPEGKAASRSNAGNLRGVPSPFRDQAEAYFRRLSEGK